MSKSKVCIKSILCCIISYLSLILAIYGIIIFIDNKGFDIPFLNMVSTQVDVIFNLNLNLFVISVIFTSAFILSIVFGAVSHRMLRHRWKNNAIIAIFYFLSWIPYLPLWILILPIKLIIFAWRNDFVGIAFCCFAYLCLAAWILLVIKSINDHVFSGIEVILFNVTLILYIISIVIAHFKFKDEYNDSILSIIFNVLIWIAFLPVAIAFAPITIIVFIVINASSGGGSSYSSSSSSSYSSGSSSSSYSSNADYDYTVYDGGFTRYLKKVDYCSDAYPNSPYYGRYYTRFKDNAGNYWRSYDNNNSFIKETREQVSRGY